MIVKWLSAAAIDWLIIALSMYGLRLHPVVAFLPAVVIIGSRQHALMILGHDGVHGQAARRKGLNDFLTRWVCFSPMLIPLDGWREFHMAHHRYLGDPERDPEIEFKKRCPAFMRPFSLRVSVMDFFGLGMLEAWTLSSIVRRGATKGDALWIVAWLAIAGIVGLYAPWILLVWLFCYSTTGWMAFRVRTMSDHPVLMKTPRFRAPSGALRWLIWPHNVWLHWEHHKRPGVPFWRLGEVRKRYSLPWINDRVMG